MSLDDTVKQRDIRHARTLIAVFERSYRLEQGRFVNKIGVEASQRTIDLVSDAQLYLADLR